MSDDQFLILLMLWVIECSIGLLRLIFDSLP